MIPLILLYCWLLEHLPERRLNSDRTEMPLSALTTTIILRKTKQPQSKSHCICTGSGLKNLVLNFEDKTFCRLTSTHYYTVRSNVGLSHPRKAPEDSPEDFAMADDGRQLGTRRVALVTEAVEYSRLERLSSSTSLAETRTRKIVRTKSEDHPDVLAFLEQANTIYGAETTVRRGCTDRSTSRNLKNTTMIMRSHITTSQSWKTPLLGAFFFCAIKTEASDTKATLMKRRKLCSF